MTDADGAGFESDEATSTELGELLANAGVEVFVSTCCGGAFVPGSGPDDIHDAVAGETLVMDRCADSDGVPLPKSSPPPGDRRAWHRVVEVSETTADLHDAVRAGECPSCGEPNPALDLLTE